MGAIYGEFLLAFPEQMQTVTVYDMTARINGGWDAVEGSSQTIRAIFQHTSGKQIKDSNGNLVEGSGLELWTATSGLNGKFTTIEQIVYRIKANNEWKNEGGFIRYSLEKVVGNGTAEPNNTTWNTGGHNFG